MTADRGKAGDATSAGAGADGRDDQRAEDAVADEERAEDSGQSADRSADAGSANDGSGDGSSAGGDSGGDARVGAEDGPGAASGPGSGSDSGSDGADGEPEVDQPTAMFRVVSPDADSGASAGSSVDEATLRAEQMTAAFFGSGKRGASSTSEGEAEEAADTASDGDTADTEGAKATEDGEAAGADPEGEPGADTATAIFRTPESVCAAKSGKAADTASDEAPDEDQGSADGEAGADGENEAGDVTVDQPTAVFRVAGEQTGDGANSRTDGGETADDGAQDAAEDTAGTPSGSAQDPRVPHARDAAPAGPEQAPDAASSAAEESGEAQQPGEETKRAGARSAQETAKPEKAAAAATAASTAAVGDAEPTAETDETDETGTTDKTPAAQADGKADAKTGEDDSAESDSERTSQFVPLRSADAPPRPTKPPVIPPKPLGKPHPPGGRQAQPLPEEGAADTAQPAQAAAEPQLTEADLTRQQPRPDQKPLDLLAQLTNTPPPPETPLRMILRRIKIWTPLVVLLAIVFMVVQAVRPLPDPELKLTAAPAYKFSGQRPSMPWPSEGQAAMDVEGLGSFGSSGSRRQVPIASVAKVMTAYVILRDHPVRKGKDGEHITVDKKAEDEAGLSAQNESTVDVQRGDRITEREAIQAIMIASANNVARLLARWDAGSEKAFTKKMNKAAEDLGMTRTRYTDPSGLTSSTVSTAQDQMKLAKKVMDSSLFRETVRMPSYTDTKGKKHANWNKLVPLDGVVGIKTGTTTKAGGNLLFAAEKNIGGTRQLIVGAVLGQHKPSILDTVLGVSKKLIDAGQNSLRARKVVHKGDVVGYADDQLGGRTPVVATKDVTAVGWSGLKVTLDVKGSAKGVPHEAHAGDTVGTLTAGDGPGQVRVPVALQKDMTEPGFGAKLTRIL